MNNSSCSFILNSDLEDLSNGVSAIQPVAGRQVTSSVDNTDYDTLNQPGWYDVYSTDIAVSHAPANGLGRVLLRVDSVNVQGRLGCHTNRCQMVRYINFNAKSL